MRRLESGAFAIVGTGEVPTGRFERRPALESALESSRQAIMDAGIDKSEIDTVLTAGAIFSRKYNADMVFSRLVEELGLQETAHLNAQVFAGGASSSAMLNVAGALVSTGMSRAVLCVHSDKLATGVDPQEGIDIFATLGIQEEWEMPFGLHFSAVAGLVTQRYMYETGTTARQMASVCVSNRKWAELNPNAMFRKPLSIEEVLASRMLSEPLHAKESNVLADGGSAFIVTTSERARELTSTPVFVLGHSSRVTHYSISQESDITRFSYAQVGRAALSEARLEIEDMDIAEIYDSYPVFQLIALEELGFCDRGTAGAFVEAGGTWPGGRLPMTTNGGMLSQGHTGAGGGVAILVEAVRQLMGKAGDRQVTGAKFALDTSTGGTYMDVHVTILGSDVP